jgi:hypothetical protein
MGAKWDKVAGVGARILTGGGGVSNIAAKAAIGATGGAVVGGLGGLASGDGLVSGAAHGALVGGIGGAAVGGFQNYRGKVGAKLAKAQKGASAASAESISVAGASVKAATPKIVASARAGNSQATRQFRGGYKSWKNEMNTQGVNARGRRYLSERGGAARSQVVPKANLASPGFSAPARKAAGSVGINDFRLARGNVDGGFRTRKGTFLNGQMGSTPVALPNAGTGRQEYGGTHGDFGLFASAPNKYKSKYTNKLAKLWGN